jgi:NDP-sugar pyrophosphorylase family protein
MELSAAILAGGLGTRLRAAVADRPKVLAPVGGQPFVAYLLDLLVDAGFDSVVLLTGHRGEQLREELGEQYRGMRLVHSQEPLPLGTAGALHYALPLLHRRRILVVNGDSFCDVNIPEFYDRHCRLKAGATLGLVHVPNVGRFGEVKCDDIGRITGFQEKGGIAKPGWINSGVYLIERSLIAALPTDGALSLERQVLPGWIRRRTVYGIECGDRFIDIGTPESYAEAEAFFSMVR